MCKYEVILLSRYLSIFLVVVVVAAVFQLRLHSDTLSYTLLCLFDFNATQVPLGQIGRPVHVAVSELQLSTRTDSCLLRCLSCNTMTVTT